MDTNVQHHTLNNIDSIHQFEALFNFATIGIVVTNKQGRIINFNRFAETQFGYTKSEMIGQPVEILLPSNIHDRHLNYREHYIKNLEPRIMGHGRDLYAQTKDGATFPVEVSLSYYEINGETFVIAFVIDITVRKQHESVVLQQKSELEMVASEIRKMNLELEQKVEDRTKMLREALKELEKSKEELSVAYETEKELGELKSRFVTMASHEFRTPLSTILSSAFLLEKYNEVHPDAKVEKHLHRIKTAVSGMKSILEDFLSLGKLEEGLVQTQLEEVTPLVFNEMVQTTVNELTDLLQNGQRIQLSNVVSKPVWVDKNLVKNILINLVSNAIKFSPENKVISIDSSLVNQQLIISVKDEGIGIPAEDQQYLFERFYRAKNASNIQGTGLGLHIVVKYLELMHGRIEIDSSLGEGTTFKIFISQKQSNAAQ